MNSIQSGWVKSCVHETTRNMYVILNLTCVILRFQPNTNALNVYHFEVSHGTKISSMPYI